MASLTLYLTIASDLKNHVGVNSEKCLFCLGLWPFEISILTSEQKRSL